MTITHTSALPSRHSLLQILGLMQDAYDTALQQGLQCALENMDLRSELAAAANVQAQAVSLARSESAAEAAASKLHLQRKYATLSIVLTIWPSTCCHACSLQAQAMHSLHSCYLSLANICQSL